MIIFMEGHDGSGKTVIGQELCRRLEIFMERSPVLMKLPKIDAVFDYPSFIAGINLSIKYFSNFLSSAVFDRGPVSEYVYSKLQNRKSYLGEIVPFFMGHEILIVNCECSYLSYKNRMAKRKEPLLTKINFDEEKKAFRNVDLKKCFDDQVELMNIDTSKNSIKRCVDLILKKALDIE